MRVHRNNLLFRVGFMFTLAEDEPEKVDRCTLVGRFGLLLVPWILLNLMSWIFLGIIFGIIAQFVWRIIIFLFVGKKLVYSGHVGQDYLWEWVVGRHALCKTCVFGYEHEDAQIFDFMDNFDEFPRSPILLLIACLFGIAITVLVCIMIVVKGPELFWVVTDGAASAGRFAYNTVGWWGSALGGIAAAVMAFLLVRTAYRKFTATESGKVLVSHFKQWKSAHCTIYEVV